MAAVRFHTIAVTGSCGLIGSEVVRVMSLHCDHIIAIDNNMRCKYFGTQGDTRTNERQLLDDIHNMTLLSCDIRNRGAILDIFMRHKPQVVIHCAAQPSHELSKLIPFDDFDVNASGTVNLIEALRRSGSGGAFFFASTNKVYGDNPNYLSLREWDTRWDFADERLRDGINETMSLDNCTHSVFGASKVAADIMVQEYGRYFGMNTVCFRLGCVTGRAHSGVELHGFLSYLVRCNLLNRTYRIYGYKGKQVRDNIHGSDVARAMYTWIGRPKTGCVYNLGGGRENSVSVLEAIFMIEQLTGRRTKIEYVDQHRKGDHMCYISNTARFRTEYPEWSITLSLGDILQELVNGWSERYRKQP